MLEVRTGSRLHFGLLELAEGQPLRYGGLGLMVELPSLLIRIHTGINDGRTDDDLSERIHAVLRQRSVLGVHSIPDGVHVELLTPIRIHSGLGFGTQFACAVATGLELFSQLQNAHLQVSSEWHILHETIGFGQSLEVAQLAAWSGRGRRSSIGLHGFLHGGLILDRGHAQSSAVDVEEACAAEASSQPSTRSIATSGLILPIDWRAVLIIPRDANRISGPRECELLDAASVYPNAQRDRMYMLAQQCLDYSTGAGDFAGFVDSIDQYTLLAAQLFVNVQGGLYGGSAIARAVESAKQCGLSGVGQSSWGPTVFGFAPDEDSARAIAGRIGHQLPATNWEVIVTRPARTGATWRINSLPSFF